MKVLPLATTSKATYWAQFIYNVTQDPKQPFSGLLLDKTIATFMLWEQSKLLRKKSSIPQVIQYL